MEAEEEGDGEANIVGVIVCPGPGKSGRRAEEQTRVETGKRQLRAAARDQLLPMLGQAAGADLGASLWPCSWWRPWVDVGPESQTFLAGRLWEGPLSPQAFISQTGRCIPSLPTERRS